MEAFKIPIWLEDHHDLARINEPVRMGIPLSQGLLANASAIQVLSESQRTIPVSARPLCWWPDGSIKWLLVDFFASIPRRERVAYTLVGQESPVQASEENGPEKVAIVQNAECIAVDTGPARFEIPTEIFTPFSSVQFEGADIVSLQGSRTSLTDRDGVDYVPAVDRWVIEEKGTLRSTLLAEGRFAAPKAKPLALFKARLTFYKGQSMVRLELQIRNPRAALHPGGLWDLGDPGSIFFQDLSVQLGPCSEVRKLHWYAERPEDSRYSDVADDWLLYQDSSGGEHWNSTNHLDCSGEISVSFPGYRALARRNGESGLIAEGARANAGVRLTTTSGWLSVAVKDFWQNFPKALRWESGYLSVGLFPRESRNGHELQGGEQKRHIVFLDFGSPGRETALAMLQNPLQAWLDPAWVEKTGAVSFFVPQKDDTNREYLEYIGNVIDGPHAFVGKREVIDEYGWRNFGDLYADHEAVNHPGPGALIAHYNNQYDFIYGALVHFLRTGDRRWYQLMDESARHTIDIDIYHTDEDRSAFNHGLFWHTEHYKDAASCTHRTYSRKNGSDASAGGGPSCEHNYTSGLLHYYYLTGDPEAADAVMELADWVFALDDGSRNLLALFDDGPTGHASQTVSPLYHKPGRGAGNSINALLDGYALSNARRYFDKAEELIQRCIHPQDDIAALKLNEPEHRWSYLAFLQVLGKYLDTKVTLDEFDYYFFYARDSLLHYADWMAENEVPYKDVLHKVEIPTETWPAQDIRKCHIFHLAAKYSLVDKQALFQEKADFFFVRCLNDLLSFDSAFLTRPLVILSAYGYVHAYFSTQPLANFTFRSHCYNFGKPEKFLPQKARFKTVFSNKLKIAATDVKRILTDKWYVLKR